MLKTLIRIKKELVEMLNYGLIGLGVMSYRIGARLAKAGLLEVVYDRTKGKAEKFSAEFGADVVEELPQVPRRSEIVVTVLSDDEAVKGVVSSMLGELKGKVLLDMSTIPPSLSVELAKEAKRAGGVMFDAPVVGTSIMAEQGKLVVLLGGPAEEMRRVSPVLERLAERVIHVGGNGMGLYAKIVNNLVLGIYVAALAEA